MDHRQGNHVTTNDGAKPWPTVIAEQAARRQRIHGAAAEMFDFLLEDAAEHTRNCGRETECRHKDRLILLAHINSEGEPKP